MLKYVETKNAPAAIGPYSQGIVLTESLSFSGQIPLSPETGEVVGNTIEEQAEQVMKNVQALLESQGASFTDVVKTTCFLAIWLTLPHLTRYTQSILQVIRRAPVSP